MMITDVILNSLEIQLLVYFLYLAAWIFYTSRYYFIVIQIVQHIQGRDTGRAGHPRHAGYGIFPKHDTLTECRKKASYYGNNGGGGGEVEGFTFFAARYAETQQTTFQEFRSKYLLGFSYKKMYFFRINIKYSAKKSTRGSSCVNFPQTFLLLLWTLLKFHFYLQRTSASHICFWGFCYRKWHCLVFLSVPTVIRISKTKNKFIFYLLSLSVPWLRITWV